MILVDDTPDFYQNTLNYPKHPPCKNMDFINKKMKGKFIVLEGIDGSGKTTQVKKIVDFLFTHNFDISECSFKQSDIVHHAILKGKWENFDPYTNTLLYLASITDTLARVIIPALEKGKIVIMDRYIYSVYVRGFIRNIQTEILDVLFCLRQPDLILYFDIDEKEALKRKNVKIDGELSYWEAGGDLEISNNRIENWLLYQKRVRQAYQDLFMKHKNILWINAAETKENVYGQVVKAVSKII